jgi:death on curing protein
VTSWRWVNLDVTYAIHDRQLAQHGGMDGVRDAGAVDSALARPRNLAVYENPDAAQLGAAYAYGLARNHGFSDGNKRTAWVVARLFLADNGFKLAFTSMEAIQAMQSVAAGTVDEAELSHWLRIRLMP